MIEPNAKQIIEAAERKFGCVLAISEHPQGGYVLLIRRSVPRKGQPFMTIRGIVNGLGKVDFAWGRYRQAKEAARKDFQERSEGK